MAINAKFIYQMFVAAFCLLTIIVFCYVLGASELAVQKAKAEITRLIKEELIRLVCVKHKEVQMEMFVYVSHLEMCLCIL